jgi:hypothetical protein
MTEYNNNRAPIAGSMSVWLLVIGVIAAMLIAYLAFRVGDRPGGNLPTPQAAATARGDNRTAGEGTRLGGANGDSRADKSVSGNPPSGAGASGTSGGSAGTSRATGGPGPGRGGG